MAAEQAPKDRLTSERASVLDVFENFLGASIATITDHHLESLAPSEANELVEQIDIFLEAASGEDFPEDAIALDGFASPIIIPFDRTEPQTTRRAKQVSLAHSEVIIPLQEVGLDYTRYGRKHLISLCAWARRNEKLLRAHVFSLARTPEVLEAVEPDQLTELADWLMENLTRGDREGDLQKLIPNWQSKDRDELLAALSPLVYSTMQDAVGGGVFGVSLSFTQATAGLFYRFCAETVGGGTSNSSASLFSHAALLHDMELPAIEDLKDEDFVSIRLESEDFGEFRLVLERALQKISREVQEGHDLNSSFRNNLDEVRWRAELLRREVRDKTLARYLKPAAQNVAVGSFVSTAAAAAASSVQGPLDLTSLAVRFGTSAILGALFALLFYSPPTRKRRLLKFYDVLLDGR
jgi:hypothetical protein